MPDLADLAGHIKRFSHLVRKYADPDFESRRAEFAAQLRSYAAARFGEPAAVPIDEGFALVNRIEDGYQAILAALDAAAISRRSPETRVAAAVARLWDDVRVLFEKSESYLAGHTRLDARAGVRVKEEENNAFDPDAILDALARNIATTLGMEATPNEWLRDDGVVELPPLPCPSEPAVFESGSTNLLPSAGETGRSSTLRLPVPRRRTALRPARSRRRPAPRNRPCLPASTPARRPLRR